MPTITEREAEIILETVRQIRLESRKPKPRMIRISNLTDRIAVIVNKSKRRKA